MYFRKQKRCISDPVTIHRIYIKELIHVLRRNYRLGGEEWQRGYEVGNEITRVSRHSEATVEPHIGLHKLN